MSRMPTPVRRGVAQQPVDRGDRADVQPARGRRGDQGLGAAEDPAEDDLVQVAAGELPRRRPRPRRLDVEAGDQRLGQLPDASWTEQRAESLIARFDVKAPGPGTPARQLSGGNLQKVVLGREFSSGQGPGRRVAHARAGRGRDQPRSHGLLREAAADGVGILLVSEDLDEILVLADRVLVMYEGRVVGEADAGAATVEELGLLMAGGGAREPA